MEGVYVITEAKFNFLPKFKKDENLEKYEKDAEEAQRILNNAGVDSKTTPHNVSKLVLRFLDILQNISGVVTLPLCFTVILIPLHLINRFWSMAMNAGQELLARKEGEKILSKLRQLENEAKDSKLKAKYKKAADDLDEKISKIGR